MPSALVIEPEPGDMAICELDLKRNRLGTLGTGQAERRVATCQQQVDWGSYWLEAGALLAEVSGDAMRHRYWLWRPLVAD